MRSWCRNTFAPSAAEATAVFPLAMVETDMLEAADACGADDCWLADWLLPPHAAAPIRRTAAMAMLRAVLLLSFYVRWMRGKVDHSTAISAWFAFNKPLTVAR